MQISSLLSFKLVFISTSLLSAAVALKLSAPAIADFAVTDVPTIYNGVVSWLRPPYLYLVINCIIITIVASSKFQSKLQSPAPPPPLVPIAAVPPNGIVFAAPPLAVPHVQHIVPPREFFDDGRNRAVFAEAVGIPLVAPPPEPVNLEYADRFSDLNRFEDVEISPEPVGFEYGGSFSDLNRFEDVKSSLEPVSYEYGGSFNDLNRFEDVKSSPEYGDGYNDLNSSEDVKGSPETEIELVSAADINATVDATTPEVEIDVSRDEFSISKSSWSPSLLPPVITRKKGSSEFPVSSQKPPVSSRFGHRRSIKASPEGLRFVET